MRLLPIASATVTNQDIGDAVEIFNAVLSGDDPLMVVATFQITGRDGGDVVDLNFRGVVGGRLLFENLVMYPGTATESLEVQTLPFRWKDGETLVITLESSDTDDDSVTITTIIEQAESGGGGETKEDIYDHFTSSDRQNTFRADVNKIANDVVNKFGAGRPRIL